MGNANPAAIETRPAVVPRLELPKTRLQLLEDELIRLGKDSGVTMRVPLDEVKSVALVRRMDPTMFIFLALAAAMIVIPRFVATYSVLEIVLYLGALFCLLIALFGAMGQKLVIELADRSLEMPIDDDRDVGEGFAVSLQTILRRRNGTWKQQ